MALVYDAHVGEWGLRISKTTCKAMVLSTPAGLDLRRQDILPVDCLPFASIACSTDPRSLFCLPPPLRRRTGSAT